MQPFAQFVVPDHDELDPGTLRAIIRQKGVSVGRNVSSCWASRVHVSQASAGPVRKNLLDQLGCCVYIGHGQDNQGLLTGLLVDAAVSIIHVNAVIRELAGEPAERAGTI